MYPALQVIGQEEAILEKLQYEYWEAGLLGIAEEAAKLEETGGQVMEEYYRKMAEESTHTEEVMIEMIKIESGIQAGGGDE